MERIYFIISPNNNPRDVKGTVGNLIENDFKITDTIRNRSNII